MSEKTCRNCKIKFKPERPFQTCCSPLCAINESNLQRIKKAKKERKEQTKEMKAKLMTHSDWLQILQKVFNTYIRLRDKGKPCISCGTTANVKIDAGHYYPAGNYQFLRFHEDNCNSQCSTCNVRLSGNFAEYTPRLIERIGQERVQWLADHRHDKLELSIPDIQELIKTYKAKIKLITNE